MSLTKTQQNEMTQLKSSNERFERRLKSSQEELNKLKRVLEILVEKYSIGDEELNGIYIESSK